MQFFVNLDSGLVTGSLTGNTAAAPEFKFQAAHPLEVKFHRAGIPERLPEGIPLVFAFKETGKFDAAPAAFANNFTRPGADDGFYVGSVATDNEACATLIAADSSLTNDQSARALGCQFAWLPAGATLYTKSSVFTGSLRNSVLREADISLAQSGDTPGTGDGEEVTTGDGDTVGLG